MAFALRYLKDLSLANSQITSEGLLYLSQQLIRMRHLYLNGCSQVPFSSPPLSLVTPHSPSDY